MANKKILYVGGLAEECNEKVLHSAFVVFGDVIDINIPIDYATNKHRGFGYDNEAVTDLLYILPYLNMKSFD